MLKFPRAKRPLRDAKAELVALEETINGALEKACAAGQEPPEWTIAADEEAYQALCRISALMQAYELIYRDPGCDSRFRDGSQPQVVSVFRTVFGDVVIERVATYRHTIAAKAA